MTTTIPVILPLPPTSEVALERNITRFFSGEPCKNGHISDRRSGSGECVSCNRAAAAKYVTSGKERIHRHARAKKLKEQGEFTTTFRKKNIPIRYKISYDQFEKMVSDQNNLCAICGKPETIFDKRTGSIRALAIDHCHKTNRVRGLLCQACNTALGKFNDDIALLEKAVLYVKMMER